MNDPSQSETIKLDSEDAIRYWTRELNVTEEQLRTAVGQVGDDADAVRQHIAGGNA